MEMNDLQSVHLALWNERDAEQRIKFASKIYSPSIRMYDKDFILEGREAVLQFIDKLLKDDPAFTFRAEGEMQVTQHAARLFWSIELGAASLRGMDLFIMREGMVEELYVFMDL